MKTALSRQDIDAFDRYMDWPSQIVGGCVKPVWHDDSGFTFVVGGRTFAVAPVARTVQEIPGATAPSQTANAPDAFEGEVAPDRSVSLRAFAVSLEQYGNIELIEGGSNFTLTIDGNALVQWEAPPGAWSPNGCTAVLLRVDHTHVHALPVVTFDAIERVDFVPYAKAGTPGADTTVWLFDRATRNVRATDIVVNDGGLIVLARWSDTGGFAYLLQSTRDGKALSLLELDATTAKHRIVLCETNSTFVTGLDFLFWGSRFQFTLIPETRQFLWLSERTGIRQLFLYDTAGKCRKQLTNSSDPVDCVERVNAENATIYFTTLRAGVPFDRHLFSCDFEGKNLRQLTELPGNHAVEFSPCNRYFVDNHCSPLHAPTATLRAIDGEAVLRLSSADTTALVALGRNPPELCSVKADDGETDLFGAIYQPADFDSNCLYPVIDYINAGPFERSVPMTFLPELQALQAEALAQLGFVVVIIDGRGLPGRSKAFQDFTYGRIGQCEIADHEHVIREVARERAFMNLDRVGVIGHSWGGYFALRAMLMSPDFFKVGVASAPGELTEHAMIMEPYMDLPARNPDGYAAGLNAPHAGKLKGKLLLAHGTSDANAPLSTTMRMVAALVAADVPHDLLLLPGEGHSLQRNRYWQRRVCEYFLENLSA